MLPGKAEVFATKKIINILLTLRLICRVNVALLSVLMYVTEAWGDRHPAHLALIQKLFAGTGYALPLILVVVIAVGGQESHHHRVEERSHRGQIDPFFQYGQLQAMVSLVLILACLVITIVSLILMLRVRHHHHHHSHREGQRVRPAVGVEDSSNTVVESGGGSDTQRLLVSEEEEEEEVVENGQANVDVVPAPPNEPVAIEDLANTCSTRQCTNIQR